MTRLHRCIALISVAIGMACGARVGVAQEAAPSPLATPQVTEEKVTQAIRKGVDYLLAQQQDGNWEKGAWPADNCRHGGLSCLVLYSLLHVGQSLDDPRLKPRSDELAPAVAWVSQLNPTGTYTAALQANVLALLPKKPENAKQLNRIRDLLMGSMLKDGGHSYFLDPKVSQTHGSDNSNTQYANLGMWAINDADVLVPVKYWAEQDKYWRGLAAADGGWPYRAGTGTTYRMTAAGMASLYVTAEYMDNTVRLESKPDPVLDAGLAYLAKHFGDRLGDLGYANGYFLYGVERVGLASGRKFLGTTNWFTEGAAYLLRRQEADGHWSMGESEVANERITTAFALLFLARGRNPVVFNKLEYDGPWDARRRDATNLTHWMSRQFERPINWQVVNMQVSPDEWLDAPVLLITGSKDPGFSEEQVGKLRKFVYEGGLIFSTADGGSAAFTAAMQRYAEEIVDRKYAWRKLPASHEVFKTYQTMKDPPPLLGMGNGIRELWLHSPEDLGATWQRKEHVTEKEKKEGKLGKERPWDMAANVFFYANGRGSMRSKLQSTAVVETTARPVQSMVLGRLKYKGNWDPEPGALDRLRRIAFNRWSTSIELKTVDLADVASLKGLSVLYMTGTEKFELPLDDRMALQKFLDAGGILMADAANSSKAFDESFQELVHKQLYPVGKWDVLDNRSTLYFGSVKGTQPIKETHLRPATIAAVGGDVTSPRIYALVTPDTRAVRVLYSPFDITLGLLGTTTTGFSGYTPESAEALARNILLYANAAATKK